MLQLFYKLCGIWQEPSWCPLLFVTHRYYINAKISECAKIREKISSSMSFQFILNFNVPTCSIFGEHNTITSNNTKKNSIVCILNVCRKLSLPLWFVSKRGLFNESGLVFLNDVGLWCTKKFSTILLVKRKVRSKIS